MAQCDVCKLEMNTADGCTPAKMQITITKTKEVIVYDRIRVGDHRWDDDPRCGDCGAKNGHQHHSGCDHETCPRCGGQAIGCPCNEVGQWADIIES